MPRSQAAIDMMRDHYIVPFPAWSTLTMLVLAGFTYSLFMLMPYLLPPRARRRAYQRAAFQSRTSGITHTVSRHYAHAHYFSL